MPFCRLLPVAIAVLLAMQANWTAAQRRPQRPPDRLKQGEAAPDFSLKSPDGKAEFQLSKYRGKKPVALGSYT